MTVSDQVVPIDGGRKMLLDMLEAIAAFGRARAERRAAEALRIDDSRNSKTADDGQANS